MKSHTVPKRLLRQFAYMNEVTGSPRLWRYEKGRPPYPNASPKTATRVDGHFANPNDEQLEAMVERRLADEIEDPVNKFMDDLGDPSFAMTDLQRRQMTNYISLLFSRSMARRKATKHVIQLRDYALQQFLANEVQLITVATHWNLDVYFRRIPLGRLITADDVVRIAQKHIASSAVRLDEQESYA